MSGLPEVLMCLLVTACNVGLPQEQGICHLQLHYS
jgi:hypothetical protein